MLKYTQEFIRYDEIKEGDILFFHGAKERVVKVTEIPAPANDHYPNEKKIYFKLEPVDKEDEMILGKFYSHGEYGGVGCLTVLKITPHIIAV